MMDSGACVRPAVDDRDAAWRGIVAQYQLAGEKERLLRLQETLGVSVSTCLTLLWSAANRHGAITGDCAAAVARASSDFQNRVLGPLRQARNGLGGWSGRGMSEAAALRTSILSVELDAESLEQRLVLDLIAPAGAREEAADPLGDACLNLARYLRALGKVPDAESRQALALSISNAVVEYDGVHVGQIWTRAWEAA